MTDKQLQANAFYLKNLVNSPLQPLTEFCFLERLERYFGALFNADIHNLLTSLPESVTDAEKISVLRDILNNKEKCSVENISPDTEKIIEDIKSKVKITDITNPGFDTKLSMVFDALNLPQKQRVLVQCFLMAQKNPMLREMLESFDLPVMDDMICEENFPFFAAMCAIPLGNVKQMLEPNTTLFEMNILTQKYDSIRLHDGFIKLVRTRFKSTEEVRVALIGETLSSDLHIDNFLHMADTFKNIKTLLQKSVQSKIRGVNILLHGAVGSGKTSFAVAVCNDANLRLYSGCGDETGTDARRNKLKQMQKLLKADSNAVLLFDDAEDILEQDRFPGRNNEKLTLHRLLENNATPVIWVVHSIREIPNSCLRRFSLTAEISTPDDDTRKDVWAGVFKKHNVQFDYEKMSQEIKEPDVPLGILDNAVRNAEITGNPDMVPYTLNSFLETLHGRKKKDTVKPDNFNTELLNTDTDLNMLADRIAKKKLHKFSLCLYGAPGTGKTAFASHLAHVLNMPIVKKRASDLKGSYVGETEKNIANAFAEARSKKAILVFDEADSFLQDRNKAQRSWEVSSVNEMLTQMEQADFPFICTTNIMDSLDNASLRRFTFKVKYDFLTPKQVLIAFNEFFGQTVNDADIKKCVNLAPGDFVVVKNKAEILDITNPDELLDMLLQEQSVKSHNVQKIGF